MPVITLPHTKPGHVRATPVKNNTALGYVELPTPLQVPAVGSIALEPTTEKWCWKLETVIYGVDDTAEYVTVSPVDTTERDLIRVDPGTFTSSHYQPEPAWWAALKSGLRGMTGEPGEDGENGTDGEDGKDGFTNEQAVKLLNRADEAVARAESEANTAVGVVTQIRDNITNETDKAVTRANIPGVVAVEIGKAETVVAAAAAAVDANPKIAALERAVPYPKLRKWYEAYDNSKTLSVQVLVVGDSISEGTGATRLANRWITLLQGYLNLSKGNPSGATFPFIPGRYATNAPEKPVVDVGTVVGGYGWGLGWRTVSLRDATSKLTYTFTGTRFSVMYLKNSTSGVMKISVDNNIAVARVDTAGTTNNAAKWDSIEFEHGEHVVTIERDVSSIDGRYVWVQGVLTYDGDKTSGVRIIDSAKHGVTANTQLSVANNGYLAEAARASGTYDLMIMGLGTNDAGGSVPAATYAANTQNLIDKMRAEAGFIGSIILLNMFKGGGRTDALWNQYGAELAKIASSDPDITYVDLRWNMPDVPTPYNDPIGQGMYADTLHPTDTGHRKIAGILANVLS